MSLQADHGLEHIEINPLCAELIYNAIIVDSSWIFIDIDKDRRRVTCIEDLDRIEEGNKGRDDSDTTLVRSDVLLIPTPFTVQYRPYFHTCRSWNLRPGDVYSIGSQVPKLKLSVDETFSFRFDSVGPLEGKWSYNGTTHSICCSGQGEDLILVRPDDSDIKHLFTVLLYSDYYTITWGLDRPSTLPVCPLVACKIDGCS